MAQRAVRELLRMDRERSIVMAFSEEDAERLTGLSIRQLRYWDRTGFFRPAFAAEDRRAPYGRVYSFKDIVALRVLSALKNTHKVSLQHLRQVSEKLAHLEDDLWTKTTLYVLNRKVVFADPETGTPREVVSGQFVVPEISLRAAMNDTEEAVRRSRERSEEQIGRVDRRRNVNHNVAVVAGTRIPISAIRRFHQAGYSAERIIDEYPDLTHADIEAALAAKEVSPEAA